MISTTRRFYENYFGCEADDAMPSQYNKLDLVMTCIVLVIPVATLVIANTALLIIALGKGEYFLLYQNQATTN